MKWIWIGEIQIRSIDLFIHFFNLKKHLFLEYFEWISVFGILALVSCNATTCEILLLFFWSLNNVLYEYRFYTFLCLYNIWKKLILSLKSNTQLRSRSSHWIWNSRFHIYRKRNWCGYPLYMIIWYVLTSCFFKPDLGRLGNESEPKRKRTD